MSKSLTFELKTEDDIEKINTLTFNKIKKFKQLDTLCIKKGVNICGEDYRTTDFGAYTYFVYNLNDCLLLSKDLLTKNDVKMMEFKCYLYVCVGSDGTIGFFDDEIFEKVERDVDDFPTLVKYGKMGKIYESDFEELKAGNEEIGYLLSAKCGSAFPPLPCMKNERNLIILGSKLITKIYR